MQRRTHTLDSALRRPLLAVMVGLALIAVFSIPASHSQSGAPEAEMELDVTQGGFCDGADCYAATGKDFTLVVNVVSAPEAGYVLAATYVDFGIYVPGNSEDGAGPNTCDDGIDNGGLNGDFHKDRWDDDCATVPLLYTPRSAVDEIVWPDVGAGIELRLEPGPGLLSHGGLTSITPPLPTSHYLGPVLELEMGCPPAPVDATVELLPIGSPLAGLDGAVLIEPDTWAEAIPDADEITLHCVGKQAGPGDTDGDGCTDLTENGADETQGGRRSYVNPYDFYDVSGDGYISLFTDILQVTSRYGLEEGDPGYDPIYDRGPVPPGGDPWDMTAPDGVIDDIDVDGIMAQYLHSCQ